MDSPSLHESLAARILIDRTGISSAARHLALTCGYGRLAWCARPLADELLGIARMDCCILITLEED